MASEWGGQAGEYVEIAVADTGIGMGRKTRSAHAFEPFFTTKEAGKGTGLGLSLWSTGSSRNPTATIRSIANPASARASRSICPARDRPSRTPARNRKDAGVRPRHRLILVVEDDPAVRATTSSMLRDLGYTVLEAGSGPAALSQLRVAKIDLVFGDVILPDGMSGVDLANGIWRVASATPVLLTSGYTAQRLNMMRAAPHFEVLKKPYSEAELSEAVSAALTTARPVKSLR